MKKYSLVTLLIIGVLILTACGGTGSKNHDLPCPGWSHLTGIGACTAQLDHVYGQSSYSSVIDAGNSLKFDLIGNAIINDAVNTRFVSADGTVVDTNQRLLAGTYFATVNDPSQSGFFTLDSTKQSSTFDLNLEYVKLTNN